MKVWAWGHSHRMCLVSGVGASFDAFRHVVLSIFCARVVKSYLFLIKIDNLCRLYFFVPARRSKQSWIDCHRLVQLGTSAHNNPSSEVLTKISNSVSTALRITGTCLVIPDHAPFDIKRKFLPEICGRKNKLLQSAFRDPTCAIG